MPGPVRPGEVHSLGPYMSSFGRGAACAQSSTWRTSFTHLTARTLSKGHTRMRPHPPPPLSRRAVLAAAASVALATAAGLTLPQSAGAAETTPVGFGAGTTGGGSATAVTVSTLDAFKTAVTG